MEREFIMTLIGRDRPGLVEAVAKAVADHNGNWLESRMCHLSGEFAGILRVQVSSEQEKSLAAALEKLGEQGLTVTTRSKADEPATESSPPAILEILGQDRPGIIRQISSALAKEKINVEELHTERTSAPMSGELLFKARILLHVPQDCDSSSLRKTLQQIGEDLQIDVSLSQG